MALSLTLAMSFGYDLLAAVGTQNKNIRAISSTWPVFGSTHDLGNVSESPTPVMTTGISLPEEPQRFITVADSSWCTQQN
ncbi:hypothetical protein Ac2012v2_004097 [Leucoagaricus gongylophorus]